MILLYSNICILSWAGNDYKGPVEYICRGPWAWLVLNAVTCAF